jgi:hypothetical protein
MQREFKMQYKIRKILETLETGRHFPLSSEFHENVPSLVTHSNRGLKGKFIFSTIKLININHAWASNHQ